MIERHPYYTLARVREILRSANQQFDGPGVALVVDARGVITSDLEDSRDPWQYKVEVPGDGKPYDAHAEARRFLAAWRDRKTPYSCASVGCHAVASFVAKDNKPELWALCSRHYSALDTLKQLSYAPWGG